MNQVILYLLLVTVAITAVAADSSKFVRIGKFGSRTIFVSSEDKAVTYNGAKTACQSNGMKLASILSSQENDAVGSHLLKRAKAGDNVTNGWIGIIPGSKIIWVAGDRPTGYKNWSGSPPASGQCIFMSANKNWSASGCSNDYTIARAVCQKVG